MKIVDDCNVWKKSRNQSKRGHRYECWEYLCPVIVKWVGLECKLRAENSRTVVGLCFGSEILEFDHQL
jgi:hypothetical protein